MYEKEKRGGRGRRESVCILTMERQSNAWLERRLPNHPHNQIDTSLWYIADDNAGKNRGNTYPYVTVTPVTVMGSVAFLWLVGRG